MRLAARTTWLALAMTAVPGIAAPSPDPAASPSGAAAAAPVTPLALAAAIAPAARIVPEALVAPAAARPVTVARYSFDAGAGATGRVAEDSGRGTALTLRSAAGGRVTFPGTRADRDAVFPAPCAGTQATCPRALLEGTDDADLDPGTRAFRWGASVRVIKAQVRGSSNVVQKGVVDTESQWKMQLGARHGKAQCVVVGRGSAKVYLVRSSAGVADGKWHDIMCRRSGTGLTVSVDGRVRGRVTVPAALSIANAMPLRIGGPNFNTRSDMYHGRLDEVYARLG
jgi:hypothetical protein